MINFSENIAKSNDESGFTTAELLGNAALGVVAVVVIWGLLQAVGVDVVARIRELILSDGGAGAGGTPAP